MSLGSMSSPLSVCWDITSHCNDSCSFCYRVIAKKDLGIFQHLAILEKLLDAGVRKISFVGGEVLLVKHLPMLLRRTRDAGVIVSLVTNGALLERRWPEIGSYLNWITLPLDGSNPESQVGMSRMVGHFERVLSILDWLDNDRRIAIKVNTVVSAANVSELSAIGGLLRQHRLSRWKLFQFFPVRGAARRMEDRYAIDRQSYLNAARPLVATMAHRGCRVTLADHEYLERNYFSISPDGSVRTTVGIDDVIVGNLTTDAVFKIWSRPEFDQAKHAFHRSWLLGASDGDSESLSKVGESAK